MALSCRSFRIIAVLVICGKQPSSGLLQLCAVNVCVYWLHYAPPLYYSTSSLHLGSTSSSRLSSRAVPSPRLTSTAHPLNPPCHGITHYPRKVTTPCLCEWGPAATARLLLSRSAVESLPILQDFDIFGSSRVWIFLDIFSTGSYCRCFLLDATLSQPACLLGPD